MSVYFAADYFKEKGKWFTGRRSNVKEREWDCRATWPRLYRRIIIDKLLIWRTPKPQQAATELQMFCDSLQCFIFIEPRSTVNSIKVLAPLLIPSVYHCFMYILSVPPYVVCLYWNKTWLRKKQCLEFLASTCMALVLVTRAFASK